MNIQDIPGTHRFCEADIDEAWRLFTSQYEDGASVLSDDEQEFVSLAHLAERMQRESGTYPTLDETRNAPRR